MAKYGIKGIDSQKLKQYNGKKSIFWLEQREKRDFKEGGESMAATIADVANLAGCAITTVSRAFSVPEKVRPQTRERILQAAETLRYSPNAIARAMVHQRNHNLAFVVDLSLIHILLPAGRSGCPASPAVQDPCQASGTHTAARARAGRPDRG